MTQPKTRHILLIPLILHLLLSPCYALDTPKGTNAGVYWDIPFLPFKLHVGTNGVSISGSSSIATPIGTFGLEASQDIIQMKKPATIQNVVIEKKDLMLVVRNRHKWGDKIYKIEDGKELSVFTNGQTLISAKNGNVIIDVSDGNVDEIRFAGKREIFSSSPSGQPISNQIIPMVLNIRYAGHSMNNLNNFKNLANGGVLHSGDLYKILFTAPENSYVYIFNTDDTGKMVRLFPMKDFKGVTVNNANPIQGGKIYYIPSQNKSFKLDTQTGTGQIYYFAVKNRDTRLEQDDFAQGSAQPVLNYLDTIGREYINTVMFVHQ